MVESVCMKAGTPDACTRRTFSFTHVLLITELSGFQLHLAFLLYQRKITESVIIPQLLPSLNDLKLILSLDFSFVNECSIVLSEDLQDFLVHVLLSFQASISFKKLFQRVKYSYLFICHPFSTDSNSLAFLLTLKFCEWKIRLIFFFQCWCHPGY